MKPDIGKRAPSGGIGDPPTAQERGDNLRTPSGPSGAPPAPKKRPGRPPSPGLKNVSLQLMVPAEIRRRLKTEAAAREISAGALFVQVWEAWVKGQTSEEERAASGKPLL